MKLQSILLITILVSLPIVSSFSTPVHNDAIVYMDDSEEVLKAVEELTALNPSAKVLKFDTDSSMLFLWRMTGAVYVVGHGDETGLRYGIQGQYEVLSWDTIHTIFGTIWTQKVLFVSCNSYEPTKDFSNAKVSFYGLQGVQDAILASRFTTFLRYFNEDREKSLEFLKLYSARASEISKGAKQFLLPVFDPGDGGGGGGGGGSPPSTPSGFSVTMNADNGLTLTWNSQGSTVGYRIERRVAGTTSWQYVKYIANAGSWSDYGVSSNTRYEYRMRAENVYGNSGFTSAKSDSTCSYGYNAYLAAAHSRVSGYTGPMQHLISAGSYAYFYLVNPQVYSWAGLAAWVSISLYTFRVIIETVSDTIDSLKDMLDAAAIVTAITAAVSASLAFIPVLLTVALLAMAALVIILIADIIITVAKSVINQFHTEIESMLSEGIFTVHDNTVFSFIVDMDETTTCFNKVVNFNPFGSTIISSFNELRSSSTRYSGVRDFFHYEQRDLVQPIYNTWTASASSFTQSTYNSLATVTFGLVGDSDFDINTHRFYDESTYANPWIFNLVHRLAWGDIPLGDWYYNEMGTDGTASEMSLLYTLAVNQGAPI